MDDIVTPFEPSKIKMDSKVHSIYTLMSRIKHGEIVTPPYQRNNVWDQATKSRLIESLMVRIPIPVFYMDATEEERWRIIDGLQRISALKEFLVDKTLKLEGLEYIPSFEGLTYDELPRSYIRRIEETEVTIIFINQGTPDNVKFNIFKRINTGGLPLSQQEIRHALNDGRPSKLLSELAQWQGITSLWGQENIRMELNALILRMLGYQLFDPEYIFSKSLDDYLDEAMKKIYSLNDESVSRLKLKFQNSIRDLKAIFGDDAFRKKSLNKRKNPINKNIFETWMAVIFQLSKSERSLLVKKKELVVQMFDKLQDNSRFGFAISSRKPESMKARHEMLSIKIAEILKK